MSLPAEQLGNLPSSPLFVQAAEDWYRKKVASGRWSEKVAKNVGRYVRSWKASLGARPVGEIQILEMELYEAQRAARKGRKGGAQIGAFSLNQERSYLRQFLRWARTHGWIAHDPTSCWEHREEVVQRKYVPLALEEERRLCRKAPRWLARIVTVGIATGLRLGTIRALRWSMVGRRQISVGWVTILTIPPQIMKTRKPHWTVLSHAALEAMGPAKKPGDAIFTIPSAPMVAYYFKRSVKAAGLDPACTFHDTRRTFVARLAACGTPMNVVMRLGGWKRPTTMLNHYCELQEEVALDAVEKIHRPQSRKKN